MTQRAFRPTGAVLWRRRLTACAAALVTALRAGCSAVKSADNGSAGAGGAANGSAGADSFGVPAVAGEVSQGGKLVMALSAEPDKLDPTLARSLVGRHVFEAICEKLYVVDAQARMVPQLASALPRDPSYYDAAKVHLDAISYRMITDANIRAANLRSGDVQVADTLSALDVPSLRKERSLSVLQSQSLGYQGVTFNVGNVDGVGTPAKKINRPSALDPRVRQPFDYARQRAAVRGARRRARTGGRAVRPPPAPLHRRAAGGDPHFGQACGHRPPAGDPRPGAGAVRPAGRLHLRRALPRRGRPVPRVRAAADPRP